MTYYDVLKESDFLHKIIRELSIDEKQTYHIPETIPILYKYSSISEYVVENLCNGQISLSPISSFNDYYDSTVHTNVSPEKRKDEIGEINAMMKNLGTNYCLPEEQAEYTQRYYDDKVKHTFSSADYFGIKVQSLSTDSKSTLMWSHYVDSNQGICIAFDYNILPRDHLFRLMLFPVAYQNHPVDVTDYFDLDNKNCEFPIETGLMLSVLSKAPCWEYEQEWRMVNIEPFGDNGYFSFNSIVEPSKLIFGYHWLKPLFSKKRYNEHIVYVKRILNYANEKNIPVYMTSPFVGQYNQKVQAVNMGKTLSFLDSKFNNNWARDMQYYTVIHGEYMKGCLDVAL